MFGNPDGVRSLVEAWSTTPSDPQLSEHTLLRIAEPRSLCWFNADRTGLMTVVPSQVAGSGLLEIACIGDEGRAAVFAELHQSVVHQARGLDYERLEVIDRGAELDPTMGPVVRAIRRMRFTETNPGGDARVSRWDESEFDDLLEIISDAFGDHPENGNWTAVDLRARFDQPWFDPSGLLVTRVSERPVGFCWVKVHPDLVGEIYLIAVRSGQEGTGVGKALLASGVSRLFESGCDEVIAYTEVGNGPAESLFESTGFVTHRLDRRIELLL